MRFTIYFQAEISEPLTTRDTLDNLLKSGGSGSSEMLQLVIRELGIIAIHGTECYNQLQKDARDSIPDFGEAAIALSAIAAKYSGGDRAGHSSGRVTNVIGNQYISRLGTLPRPVKQEFGDDGDSGSDIPSSESSESSDDEHVGFWVHMHVS